MRILGEGILLYSADDITQDAIELPKTDPVDLLFQAEKYARHHISMGRGFLRSAEECINREFYKNGLFLMHQATEQILMGLIRVYTGYRCDIHLLSRLLNVCKCFTVQLDTIFPRQTDEEKHRFKLLQEGYNSTRYSSTFEVATGDVRALFGQVSSLLEISSDMCDTKIAELTIAAHAAVAASFDYAPALPAVINPV